MKKMGEMTFEEVMNTRNEILLQINESLKRYAERYPNDSFCNYGASVNDDYNGEGEELVRLYSKLNEIDEEIRTRK